MKSPSKTILLFLVLVSILSVLQSFFSVRFSSGNTSNATTNSWMVPVDVLHDSLASQSDYYNFGWQTFIALNWPADPSYRGRPDTTKQIGATEPSGNSIPVVWDAWQEQFNIFLPNAQNPGPWIEPNGTCGAPGAAFKVLRMFAKGDTKGMVSDAFNQATNQPLIDQDSQFVRYEVKVCASEYTYIVTNHYFNADTQMAAVSNATFKGFPKGNDPLSQSLPYWARFGATEVKASWRIFTPATPASVRNRYYHTRAILTDANGNCTDTAEIGLVGLHILRLTPTTHSTWYWASFEQVDNVKLQNEYGGVLPAHPTFNTNPPVSYGDSGYAYIPQPVVPGSGLPPAIPVGVSRTTLDTPDPVMQALNLKYSKLLKGTPFQYYQMVGTVNPPTPRGTAYTDPAYGPYPAVTLNTPMMMNTTMETYVPSFAKQSNCVTCHQSGYPIMPTPTDSPYSGKYQVFTFLLSMAQHAQGGSK